MDLNIFLFLYFYLDSKRLSRICRPGKRHFVHAKKMSGHTRPRETFTHLTKVKNPQRNIKSYHVTLEMSINVGGQTAEKKTIPQQIFQFNELATRGKNIKMICRCVYDRKRINRRATTLTVEGRKTKMLTIDDEQWEKSSLGCKLKSES